MTILGLSFFYHDSAACLVRNGEIVAAAQEERFSRKKHDPEFPERAAAYCMREAGINVKQIDLVVFYDKPFLKFERILETHFQNVPRGFSSFSMAMRLWLKQRFWIHQLIKDKLNYEGKVLYSEHHLSHAASAFYPSPFHEAAILTVDGVGEWATTTIGVGSDEDIKILSEIHFPDSLGLLYSAFTYYTGFKVNSGEYKLMGLAPYGLPKYANLIYDKLITVKDDGSFTLNLEYFDYPVGLTMTNKKFHSLFGGLPRKPESPVTQKEMDIAASIQRVTEEIVMKMVGHVHRITQKKFLCLAGGVALNCVANGKILREGPFDDVWIQPAAGDAGGALGAALLAWYQYAGGKRTIAERRDHQKASLLGPSFSDTNIQNFLDSRQIPYKMIKDDNTLYNSVAEYLTDEKVVGWFQGRMEFGPRALGSRSILGDARSPKMQKEMNLKIKFRESFRPFAPSVLYEHASSYFEIDRTSPYMLLTAFIHSDKRRELSNEEDQRTGLEKLNVQRSEIPAVTHVDYSARLQTVHKETNPRYYDLINAFYKKTGCPMIVNTSFNVRGEPIVCTPAEAYTCFMRTNMDYLVMGNFILAKDLQPKFDDAKDWRQEFELD